MQALIHTVDELRKLGYIMRQFSGPDLDRKKRCQQCSRSKASPLSLISAILEPVYQSCTQSCLLAFRNVHQRRQSSLALLPLKPSLPPAHHQAPLVSPMLLIKPPLKTLGQCQRCIANSILEKWLKRFSKAPVPSRVTREQVTLTLFCRLEMDLLQRQRILTPLRWPGQSHA